MHLTGLLLVLVRFVLANPHPAWLSLDYQYSLCPLVGMDNHLLLSGVFDFMNRSHSPSARCMARAIAEDTFQDK